MESIMSQKERLFVNAIDIEQEYKVIDFDPTKTLPPCVCIAKSIEIIAFDRLRYEDLLEAEESLSPTIFAM